MRDHRIKCFHSYQASFYYFHMVLVKIYRMTKYYLMFGLTSSRNIITFLTKKTSLSELIFPTRHARNMILCVKKIMLIISVRKQYTNVYTQVMSHQLTSTTHLYWMCWQSICYTDTLTLLLVFWGVFFCAFCFVFFTLHYIISDILQYLTTINDYLTMFINKNLHNLITKFPIE